MFNNNRKTKVCKFTLLSTVQQNRKDHETQYLEVLNDYKEDLHQYLVEETARLAESKKDEDFKIKKLPEAPKHFLSSYDSYIKMLQWEIDETVELTSQEFDSLVLDKWDWKRDWVDTYTSRAKAPLYTMGSADPRMLVRQ